MQKEGGDQQGHPKRRPKHAARVGLHHVHGQAHKEALEEVHGQGNGAQGVSQRLEAQHGAQQGVLAQRHQQQNQAREAQEHAVVAPQKHAALKNVRGEEEKEQARRRCRAQKGLRQAGGHLPVHLQVVQAQGHAKDKGGHVHQGKRGAQGEEVGHRANLQVKAHKGQGHDGRGRPGRGHQVPQGGPLGRQDQAEQGREEGEVEDEGGHQPGGVAAHQVAGVGHPGVDQGAGQEELGQRAHARHDQVKGPGGGDRHQVQGVDLQGVALEEDTGVGGLDLVVLGALAAAAVADGQDHAFQTKQGGVLHGAPLGQPPQVQVLEDGGPEALVDEVQDQVQDHQDADCLFWGWVGLRG